MKTILLIDDEKSLRQRFSKLLSKQGFNVIEATSALDVVELLMRKKDEIDLIMLDIQMPEIDGREIHEMIRDYVTIIPVMVCSVMPIQDQKLKIPRAREYFNKKDPDKVLLEKIQSILS